MRIKVYEELEKAYSTRVCRYCDRKNCKFETERKWIPSKFEIGDIHIVKCINYKFKG